MMPFICFPSWVNEVSGQTGRECQSSHHLPVSQRHKLLANAGVCQNVFKPNFVVCACALTEVSSGRSDSCPQSVVLIGGLRDLRLLCFSGSLSPSRHPVGHLFCFFLCPFPISTQKMRKKSQIYRWWRSISMKVNRKTYKQTLINQDKGLLKELREWALPPVRPLTFL